MMFKPGKREKSAEEQARIAQISEYRKRDEELMQSSDGLALRSFKNRPGEVQESTRKLAYEAMNNLSQRIELLAELHGGTAQRLESYPEDLPIPDGQRPNLNPDIAEDFPWIEEGDEMFVRMDVKGRSYVFFLPESGSVNVYKDGEYKGGNHDLALYEINSHLEDNDWFGVNSG
jgi:hypothetical protein